ncbi:cytochrome c oxidase assembly protein [Amycolatopsis tucumanensis]|uniref:Cytochrome c oxidase assembly protein n=1 Tax=Amycolatopsis tucumanensis TaxID=401106 RepID=A0ABP7JVK0_9PSEU
MTGRHGSRRIALVSGAGLLLGLVLAVVLVLRSGGGGYGALGYSDPGAVTKVCAYVLRFVVDVASAVAAGSLAYALFFTASEPNGRLSPDGWAATWVAGWAAWLWFGGIVLMMPFDMADAIGVPVSEVLGPVDFAGLFMALYEPRAWLASALVALVVAVGCRVALRWRAALGLAVLAVLGLLPPVVSGHASSGAAHDYAMNSMAFHVVVAGLWFGVLVALSLHLRRGTGQVEVAVASYQRFATGCWILIAASGIFVALLLTPPAALVTTGYGRLVLLKGVALVAVGALSVVARSRAVRDRPHRLVRLAATETAVFLVTFGVTMGMVQVSPPAVFGPELSPVEIAVGYSLPGAPNLLNLLTTWRLDLVLGLPALVAAAVYLLGARRLRWRGERWPPGRTTAWLTGCGLVFVATSSGVGAYAPAGFSEHVSSHMVLGMLAPLLLVLGGPLTLALRVLPAAATGRAPGPREWLVAVVDSGMVRALSHPAVAAGLFVASYYLLYFTGVFGWVIDEHWSRMALNVFVLAVGYQFYWIVVGIDPSPRRFPHLGRLGLVFAVMPFHAVFAVIVMTMRTVIAENYYRTLTLPWFSDLLADQRLAGIISLVAGELGLVVAQVVLLVQWYRYDRLVDFRGAPTGEEDEETMAYRAMLTKLRQSRSG